MKTHNAIRSKWMRLASGFMAAMFLTLSFAGQASARILFEDDLYMNVQSEGIIMDANNNIYPGVAATVAIQDVTVTASTYGAAGNSQTVTRVLADTNDSTCTVTGGTGTGVITVTCDNGATSGTPADTTDLQSAINAEALFVATGGSAAGVIAGGPTSLGSGADGGDVTLQFGNTGATDGTMKYNTTTSDLTIDTYGDNIDFSDDSLTTTGEIRFENSSHTRIREEAFAAYSGGTAPQCNYVNEVALDTVTQAIFTCTVIGAPNGGTWKSADNNPAPGTSAGNTLYWNGTAWTESSALTNNAGTVTISNGTTFTANGIVNLGDGADNVVINSTTWDVSGAGAITGLTGITSTGAINFSGASSLSLASVAGPANPGTCAEGDIVYNQTTNTTYICTAANTWTALASGTVDFEAVYGADADKSLSITDNLAVGFEIKEGANSYINLATTNGSELITLTPATTVTGTLTANGTFDANGVVTLGDGGDTVSINGTTLGLTSTGVGNDITFTGADDLIFDDAQLVGIVQMTDTATDWAATFALDGIVDNINSFTLTTLNNGASNVGVYDTGANLENIDPTTAVTDVQDALQKINGLIGSAADNVEDLTFYPEYPDTVVYPDGTNNRGTLESFHDNANDMNYYNWTSTNAALQDMNLRFQFPLPTDFAATGDFTFRYRTGSAVNTDNKVDIILYNITDASSCGSSLANVNAGAWATGTITAATIVGACAGISAGDIVRVDVKLYDNNGGADYADVGWVKWAYTN